MNMIHTQPDRALDVAVVGGGPAGLVAALYLRRFHRHTVVLDAGDARALRIERSWNVPGFPAGIGGPDLLRRLREQLRRAGGQVEPARIERLERRPEGGFRLLAAGRHWHARTVLLATGARDREPALPGATALRQAGLLRQCPICDGHEHTDQRIAVIGAGDHGAREALFLRHYSARVTLIPASAQGQPSAALCRRLEECGIRRWSRPARSVQPAATPPVSPDAPDPLTLRDSEDAPHPFDVLYAALGCHPLAELACTLGAGVDTTGNLVTDAHGMTDVAGLYAAGDVTGGLDQISGAWGQAAIAATALHNSL